MNNIEYLESLISKMDELTEIQKRSKSFSGDVAMTMFYKKTEDGILDNIHNANPHQMRVMLSYRWKFYTQYNDPEIFMLEAQSRIRDKKIEKLC